MDRPKWTLETMIYPTMTQHTNHARQHVPFPLIGEPEAYHPHTIEMLDDAHARKYWLNVFRKHTPGLAERAAAADGGADARERAEHFQLAFDAVLDRIESDPFTYGTLDIAILCAIRQELLAATGFDDPYRDLKHAENDAALKLLPSLLAELDGLDPDDRLRALVTGIFAGNIFDMGAAETVKLVEAGQIDFHQTRQRVTQQRWLVDHSADLQQRLMHTPYRRAVLFVDNAGADVVLGMLPFARHLLLQGTQVVLTANTRPALNDITCDELAALIDRVARFDSTIAHSFAEHALTLVPSGNGLPVIDLSRVAPELAEAAEGADLLVLEGMGRALETNYHHRFTCDTLKLGMIKEQHVAEILDGRMYDVVCRFDPAA